MIFPHITRRVKKAKKGKEPRKKDHPPAKGNAHRVKKQQRKGDTKKSMFPNNAGAVTVTPETGKGE